MHARKISSRPRSSQSRMSKAPSSQSAQRSPRCPGRRRCTSWRGRAWRRGRACAWMSVVAMRAPMRRADGRWRSRRRGRSPSLRPCSSIRMQASAWAANASLSSIRSMSLSLRPARLSAFCVAGTGPVPITAGSTPATAVARTFTSGLRPSDFARLLAHHQQCGGAVVERRAVAGRHGAHAGHERRLQGGERFHARVGPDALIALDRACGCRLRRGPRSGTISAANSPARRMRRWLSDGWRGRN